ncbi:MAG: flagellar assembly protein FliW, partial [Candidatus Angelobacter sp.]
KMPTVETKYFGPMEIAESNCIEFPAGLPAFERERRFVLIEPPAKSPLVFFQSVGTKDLCFLALPVRGIVPDYELFVASDDLALLQLKGETSSILNVLALLTVTENGHVTANLLAPVLVNRAARQAVQAVRMDQKYSHQHVIGALRQGARACS